MQSFSIINYSCDVRQFLSQIYQVRKRNESLQQTQKFSNSYIFAAELRKTLIFQASINWYNRMHSLKIKNSIPFLSKDMNMQVIYFPKRIKKLWNQNVFLFHPLDKIKTGFAMSEKWSVTLSVVYTIIYSYAEVEWKIKKNMNAETYIIHPNIQRKNCLLNICFFLTEIYYFIF